MAKVAESIAHVADEILTGRRQRSELAVEIRNAARIRNGEVHSLLKSLKAARAKAGPEHVAEIRKVTEIRHGDVISFLAAAQASRGRATREYHQEAVAQTSERRKEVKALLSAHRQRRLELTAAQHEKAAAFMRDLTSGVATLLDGFDKEDRNRAATIRKRLGAYALDRNNAVAAWHQSLDGKRAVVVSVEVGHHPGTSASVGHADAPVPPGGPAKADSSPADAAHSTDQNQSHRSGRRTFGAGGPNERGGGNSK
jgi:hypothetical protein